MRKQFRFSVFHCYTNLMKTVIISLGTHGSQKYRSNNKDCFNSIRNVTIYVMRTHYCNFHSFQTKCDFSCTYSLFLKFTVQVNGYLQFLQST